MRLFALGRKPVSFQWGQPRGSQRKYRSSAAYETPGFQRLSFGSHRSLHVLKQPLRAIFSPTFLLTLSLSHCLFDSALQNTFCKLQSPCDSKNARVPSGQETSRNRCCVAAGILCPSALLFCLSLSPHQARKWKRGNRCTSAPPSPTFWKEIEYQEAFLFSIHDLYAEKCFLSVAISLLW